MEEWVILTIIGAVIIFLLIVLRMIPKRKNKEWLVFKNTDEKNNKTSYFAQHRLTGFKTPKLENLEKLGGYIENVK